MAGLDENLENYKAQLKQVEAALLIDESNEDLKKLKEDLEEVIQLTEELNQVNEEPAIAPTPAAAVVKPELKQWKPGDRCRTIRKTDGKYHDATVDMIADDNISCTIKFDNSGSVDVVKISSLEEIEENIVVSATAADGSSQQKSAKLTRDEIDKRREIKKKKLLKKKQRMKDFEEAREAGKNRWQSFFKKGSHGKHKIKGLNKKSIFASCEDGKGKIGVGTCGTSGKAMTSYTPASSYMYKK